MARRVCKDFGRIIQKYKSEIIEKYFVFTPHSLLVPPNKNENIYIEKISNDEIKIKNKLNDRSIVSLDVHKFRERYYSPFSLEFSQLPQLEGQKKSVFSRVYEEVSPRDYKIVFDPIENRMYPSFDAHQYKLTSSVSKLKFRLPQQHELRIKIEQENKNISSAQNRILKKRKCFICLRCCTLAFLTLLFFIMFFLLIYICTTPPKKV
jgi:hypothetical protein